MFRRAIQGVALSTSLALLTVPGVGHAQTLKGTILDSSTGEPVTLTFVALLEEGREMVVSTLGEEDGSFSVTAPESGDYFLYVARSGYSTVVDGMFELGRDGVLDVQVGLTPEPIALEPLTVEADRDMSVLERSGFYDRAAVGQGHFLLHDEIVRRAPNRLTDALTGIPRFQVMRSRPVIGLRAELNPEVRVLRGSEYCSPTLYLDGSPIVYGSRADENGRAVRPDDFVDPFEVEAIEVYTRTSDMPLGIDPIGGCGVLLIWTRTR
jgi:hypothetical protein